MARRPAPLLVLLFAVIVVGAIWYRVTPRRAYNDFMQGVATGDAARLDRTVDWDRLRTHMREDLSGAVASAMRGHPAPQTGAGSVLDTVVAQATTIPGLVRVVSALVDPGPATSPADTAMVPTSITYHYRNPLRVDVRMQFAGQPDDEAVNFTFELRGPHWRLTHLWTAKMLGKRQAS